MIWGTKTAVVSGPTTRPRCEALVKAMDYTMPFLRDRAMLDTQNM